MAGGQVEAGVISASPVGSGPSPTARRWAMMVAHASRSWSPAVEWIALSMQAWPGTLHPSRAEFAALTMASTAKRVMSPRHRAIRGWMGEASASSHEAVPRARASASRMAPSTSRYSGSRGPGSRVFIRARSRARWAPGSRSAGGSVPCSEQRISTARRTRRERAALSAFPVPVPVPVAGVVMGAPFVGYVSQRRPGAQYSEDPVFRWFPGRGGVRGPQPRQHELPGPVPGARGVRVSGCRAPHSTGSRHRVPGGAVARGFCSSPRISRLRVLGGAQPGARAGRSFCPRAGGSFRPRAWCTFCPTRGGPPRSFRAKGGGLCSS